MSGWDWLWTVGSVVIGLLMLAAIFEMMRHLVGSAIGLLCGQCGFRSCSRRPNDEQG